MQEYDRTIKLFGEENFEKIKNAKVILLGVGGVGSFALDSLYNTGLTNITIVDFDTYEESNMNRQLGSHGNVGKVKVDALKERYPKVEAIHAKITPQWIDDFDFSSYDYILDAIDDVTPKVHLIQRYFTKIISTSGGAKRLDPSKIEYKSIWDTYNDPFIRKIRTELKKRGFKKKFKVVFSGENPNCIEKGSFEAVTGSFGFMMAAITINKLLSRNK
ncbi:MAG: tRNA threonylcarbamoyladenosine dehydratase [Campylobacteraceae bacterium]|nr:tRNA threonylcarbamoyladenosine dehydratase [Campylobacteraceae bacterium]